MTKSLKIGIAPEIDRDTAEFALKIVQMYCNDNNLSVIALCRPGGGKTFEFTALLEGR